MPKPVAKTKRCDPRGPDGARSVELTVLGEGGMRKSRTAKWRAAVLIAVHVVIIAHIAHWLIAGRTLSPVEPSEAMYTLNHGYLNAGFIFFALAILSTLIFGRYFCGWGCHLVAYQDFCGWLLKKSGIKPKPFRSRLLVFAPLALAIYMFIWPTAYRLVAGIPAPEVSNHLVTSDFWKTFPGLGIALLTFGVCGFAIVYVLGSKGFCTYACPYGGFFGLADNVAPGRIRVTDDCEHCGHCTATCTSNVRVHEEVAKFGMVVDPGCMKCMDCISVCPNDALYFGFGAPAIAGKTVQQDVAKPAKPAKRTYDFALWEELMMVGIGLAALLSFRGLYNQIPLLLAMAIAAIVAYVGLKLVRLLRDANARLQNLQLKRGGAMTRWGWIFAGGAVALLVFTAHSGAVQFHVWRAGRILEGLSIGDDVWLPDYSWWAEATEEQRRDLQRALADIEWADRWGLTTTPTSLQDLLWLQLASEEPGAAGETILRLVEISPGAQSYRGLASVARKMERYEDAESAYRQALEVDPAFDRARFELAAMYVQLGRSDDAIAQYREGFSVSPDDPRYGLELSRLLAARGSFQDARVTLDAVLGEHPDHAGALAERGILMLQLGDLGGIDDLRRAVDLAPELVDARYNLAVALLGLPPDDDGPARVAEAIVHLHEVVVAKPEFAAAHYNLGVATFMSGNPNEAGPHVRKSLELAPDDEQARAFLQMLESIDQP